jgi:catechol 2,3-dioxygenase-like lactoylglutathione lyase family enzyme
MTKDTQVVPQRLFAVTLGAKDVAAQRRFYETWGWEALEYSTDEYVAFDLAGVVVAFFPADRLAEEAAPGARPASDGWPPVTLAVNIIEKEDVDRVWRAAVAAGATGVHAPVDRPWGGRSGYVADPEGNRWEILWFPPMG